MCHIWTVPVTWFPVIFSSWDSNFFSSNCWAIDPIQSSLYLNFSLGESHLWHQLSRLAILQQNMQCNAMLLCSLLRYAITSFKVQLLLLYRKATPSFFSLIFTFLSRSTLVPLQIPYNGFIITLLFATKIFSSPLKYLLLLLLKN